MPAKQHQLPTNDRSELLSMFAPVELGIVSRLLGTQRNRGPGSGRGVSSRAKRFGSTVGSLAIAEYTARNTWARVCPPPADEEAPAAPCRAFAIALWNVRTPLTHSLL